MPDMLVLNGLKDTMSKAITQWSHDEDVKEIDAWLTKLIVEASANEHTQELIAKVMTCTRADGTVDTEACMEMARSKAGMADVFVPYKDSEGTLFQLAILGEKVLVLIKNGPLSSGNGQKILTFIAQHLSGDGATQLRDWTKGLLAFEKMTNMIATYKSHRPSDEQTLATDPDYSLAKGLIGEALALEDTFKKIGKSPAQLDAYFATQHECVRLYVESVKTMAVETAVGAWKTKVAGMYGLLAQQ